MVVEGNDWRRKKSRMRLRTLTMKKNRRKNKERKKKKTKIKEEKRRTKLGTRTRTMQEKGGGNRTRRGKRRVGVPKSCAFKNLVRAISACKTEQKYAGTAAPALDLPLTLSENLLARASESDAPRGKVAEVIQSK
ncbi:hypothetical protein PoB_000575200 [Plakobranchus ocellatus]|uniref:Uncharacterized protein n=1 Tax=Plakobranchus ocellatus TaxID=259542 RepID=A0AAV3Y8Y5_9GAST|nr:hypothetical protein PoB_000575200 [Plakobranchus ocellatus]